MACKPWLGWREMWTVSLFSFFLVTHYNKQYMFTVWLRCFSLDILKFRILINAYPYIAGTRQVSESGTIIVIEITGQGMYLLLKGDLASSRHWRKLAFTLHSPLHSPQMLQRPEVGQLLVCICHVMPCVVPFGRLTGRLTSSYMKWGRLQTVWVEDLQQDLALILYQMSGGHCCTVICPPPHCVFVFNVM